MIEDKAKVLTKEEFKQVINVTAAGRHGLRGVAMLYISFGLGLRVAEVAAMNVRDVMNDDGTIRDHFQISRATAKNNRNREVFLSNTKVRKAIKEYLDYRRENEAVAIVPTSPLFRSQKGGRFTAHSLQLVMKRIYRKAGMPETVSSHSARRTFATKLLSEQNVDIRTVQELLGHANISQTAVYCDTNPDTMKSVVSRVI